MVSRKLVFLALGFLGASALLQAPAAAQNMDFRLVSVGDARKCGEQCPQVIAADGTIVSSTPDTLIEFLKSQTGNKRLRSIVMFNSPGGLVLPSLKMGFVLRKVNFSTAVARVLGADTPRQGALVPGRCMSACVFTFMGGSKRMALTGSVFGIHRPYFDRSGEDPKRTGFAELDSLGQQDDLALLGQYSKIMGISQELTAKAVGTPSDTLYILTPSDVARWRLAKKQF